MNIIETYNSILKKLVLKSPEEIHSFLDEFFRTTDRIFDEISDDEMFTLIHDFRVVLFQHMTDAEKRKLVSLVVRHLAGNSSMTPQMIEYSGLIYKYVPADCRQLLYDRIISGWGAYCATNRGIVAVTTFMKYTNKTYTPAQKAQCLDIITRLKQTCIEEIRDTLIYTENNIHTRFLPVRKDVLLLIPEFLSGSSFLQPPLCLMRIKSQLEQRGISADIFDNRIYNYAIDQAVDMIAGQYTDIIVCSTPLDQVQNFFIDHRYVVFAKTCNRIRERNACRRLIVAGSHGTVDYRMLCRDISPDIIIQGEYDDAACETIIRCRSNALDTLPPSVLYREGSQWKRGTGAQAVSDWSGTALDFSVICLEDYFGYRYLKNTHVKQRRWAILQASRGCPYECTFCFNLYGRKVRFKQTDCLIDEMQQLKAMACNEIFFIDQTFTVSKDYVRELCGKIIDRDVVIPWQCETRIDLIDSETIALMKQAGCTAVWLGIESFDEHVIEVCKKGYNMDQLRRSFDILEKAGMEYHAFIMVGMEGESRQSVEHTVETIEKNRIKLSKSIIQCTPRPGTEYYTHLPAAIRDSVSHFWQIDALRGYSESDITDGFINQMVQRLMKISNTV